MLKEAIDRIVNLGQSALMPTIINVPGSPPHVQWYTDGDGQLKRLDVPPPSRFVRLSRLDDLIALGQEHFDAEVGGQKRMTCFYNREQVRLVWDHANGREGARMSLVLTDEYKFFLDAFGSPLMDVKSLRHALRFKLRKTFDSPDLVAQVSSLDFATAARQSAAADRGKESFSRDVQQAVMDDTKLPHEHQTFNVRAFSNPDLDMRFPIECILDPDPASARWMLKPLEDSLIEFEANTLGVIGKRLREGFKDTPVRVFEGSFHARERSDPDQHPF